jgi:hypothetical protein
MQCNNQCYFNVNTMYPQCKLIFVICKKHNVNAMYLQCKQYIIFNVNTMYPQCFSILVISIEHNVNAMYLQCKQYTIFNVNTMYFNICYSKAKQCKGNVFTM